MVLLLYGNFSATLKYSIIILFSILSLFAFSHLSPIKRIEGFNVKILSLIDMTQTNETRHNTDMEKINNQLLYNNQKLRRII